MYKLTKEKNLKPINKKNFKDLDLTEKELELIIKKNISIFTEEEETLLIVGQQVVNKSMGRSDLVALDGSGNLVLFEIKRDKKDIEARKEPFDIQAIRYAANFANIKTIDSLVNKIFLNYVTNNLSEFSISDAKAINLFEVSKSIINDFLKINNSINSFNQRQKIILVSNGFDEQTLSSVAWLIGNKVDISCYSIEPYEFNNEILIEFKKLLPLKKIEEFYVDVLGNNYNRKETINKTRESLPKIEALLRWGVVKAGDIITSKNESVELLANGKVKTIKGNETSLHEWLKSIYKWPAVQTYVYSIHKETGKSLSQLREEFMNSSNYELVKNDW
jgi:hypothetical protein